MASYRYTKRHAGVLAGGRPVAPGETVSLDAKAAKHPHNERMIASGALLELKKGDK